MTFMLAIVCTLMPIHMAFKIESLNWCIFFNIIDVLFLTDIVFTFFTSIPEESDEIPEIIDRVTIAKQYLSTWFVIDFSAIFPVDLYVTALLGKPSICPTHEEPGQEG